MQSSMSKEPVKRKGSVFVGMDVHAETIAVAVAEGRNVVRSLGIIPNRPEPVRRLLGKLGERSEIRVCYEAGPTGYAPLLRILPDPPCGPPQGSSWPAL